MMRGVKREFLQSYLEEYTWRRNMDVSKIGSFETILQSISQDYKSGQELSDFSLEDLSIDDELIEFDDDEVSGESLGFDRNALLPDGDVSDFYYEQTQEPVVEQTQEPVVEQTQEPVVEQTQEQVQIKEYLTIRYFRSTMYSLKVVSRF
jgi:hypothetical protein